MSLRPPAGFIRPGYDPLKVPNAPTIGTATGGDAQASVAFTAPTNVGGSAVTAYYAVSNPGRVTATAASSPVSVTGLTNGTAYTFTVWALNSYGPGAWSGASGSVTPVAPIGLFFRVGADARVNTINRITITTTGNATPFGELTNTYGYSGSLSSSTRWICAGGNNSLGDSYSTILYGGISTSGTTGSFGDLTLARNDLVGLANSTRGLFAGGYYSSGSTTTCVIDYVTIATTGNATSFGNLWTQTRYNGSCASTTRGIIAGGDASNIIGYVTIGTTGNTTDFGDLTVGRWCLGSCSNSTRGLFAGGQSSTSGYPGVNVIDYITIASTGNATDFGDLTASRGSYGSGGWGLASTTRGVFGGAYDFNIIDYVTIASVGNATDFGDLNGISPVGATASSVHGGLA
jgi:hypothetical protein